MYVAEESEEGVIQGWVKAQRRVEEMQDSLTVSASDAVRKRQAREIS